MPNSSPPLGGEGSWRRGGNVAPEEGGWRSTPRRAVDNAARRTPTPACANAADKVAVELCVSTLRLCKPGQGVQVKPRYGPFGWAYAVGRYVEERVPREWNSGAYGVAAVGDDWMARLIGLCAHLAKVLPDGADFEIVPWFVSEGRVMFVLTTRVAIAPQQRRAAGGKRRGAAVGGKLHVGGMGAVPAPADAFADAPADAPADAGIEELVVPSPVADAATGVAAAPAADAPADAPAAEVSLLSQTLQVLLPALPLHDSHFKKLRSGASVAFGAIGCWHLFLTNQFFGLGLLAVAICQIALYRLPGVWQQLLSSMAFSAMASCVTVATLFQLEPHLPGEVVHYCATLTIAMIVFGVLRTSSQLADDTDDKDDGEFFTPPSPAPEPSPATSRYSHISCKHKGHLQFSSPTSGRGAAGIRRLQRFVSGFLIIHHFYQLPTSA
ncbi:hypothetical protein T492DRAFT_889259 [Pavlovales sp. CCMP2436]|nr:hypothetical protein T492DRAFT_889259 [Pavlovales sp. CCMP2436]